MNKVTILLPLGPKSVYRQYIKEAIDSALNQSYPVDEILIISDGADVTDQEMHEWFEGDLSYQGRNSLGKDYWFKKENIYFNKRSLYRLPCNLGFISAFNVGMAVAENDLVMYLAADDTLGPDAVKDAVETYEANNQKDAWYSLTYESAEGVSDVPINAAMLSRNLWKWLGGYPPSAFAGPDALVLSRLMVHAPDRIIKVAPGKVNYYIKMHEEQETKKQFSFFAASGIMEVIRNMETQRFVPNTEIILK